MMLKSGLQVAVRLSAHNEPSRIARLSMALCAAMTKASVDGNESLLAQMLVGLHDHKGTLTATWSDEVWETDNAVDPDLPMVFLYVEYGWCSVGELHVNHMTGNDVVERTTALRVPPKLTII
jgi:hypothetical protein